MGDESMSILKRISNTISEQAKESGIPLYDFWLLKSNRKDLGEFQLNDCMSLASVLHKAPLQIAQDLVNVLENIGYFENINIAGPGFINLSLKEDFLLQELNKMLENIYYNVDVEKKRLIFMDYGGANIAKTLHVGHLRSANIGEANKRLAQFLGLDVISDVHFGDIGRQSGMVILEMMRRYPYLNYFSDKVPEKYDVLPITAKDLEDIYPTASCRAKESEEVMEEVRNLTKRIEENDPNLVALWNEIKKISIQDIKAIYKRLHTDFDLWEGESDCYPYMKKTLDYLESTHALEESEGAKVISVSKADETAPMPPLVVIKSNGATLYGTRELATLYSRIERFHPNELWYFADNRQSLYFEQVFRASYKTKLVDEDVHLAFYGFGTMNGKDGKPFKTRDGNVATLNSLLSMVSDEIGKKLSDRIEEEKKEIIKEQITIATIKYADFLPNRATDYIFDVEKFTDVEGKTGPYLLYSTIRMKSLLDKCKEIKPKFSKFKDQKDRAVALLLLDLAPILTRSFEEKSLHEIAEYLYQLTSNYNSFYQDHHVLTESSLSYKETWLALTTLVYKVNLLLLDILGIEVPEKM